MDTVQASYARIDAVLTKYALSCPQIASLNEIAFVILAEGFEALDAIIEKLRNPPLELEAATSDGGIRA